jgi:ABC-type multidrug transport system fused ATPase/permease subunit
MREVRWLLLLIRPYALSVLGSLALMTAAGVVSALDPLLMRHLIDQSFPARRFSEASVYVVLIALCFIARAVLTGLGNLSGFRISQSVGQDLRRELLQKMTRLSADWHERTMLGDKLSRFDTDVEQIAQFGSDAVNMIVRSTVFFLLNLVIMLRLNVPMTLTLLPLLPLFFLVRWRFRALIQDRARETQEGRGWAIGRIAEHLGGMIQCELLGAGEARMKESVLTWSEVVQAQWRQRSTEMAFTIAVSSVLALAILFALEFGVHEFAAGALTLGTIVAFYSYTTRIFEPVSSAMELYARSQRMLASARRVLDVTSEQPSVADTGTITIITPRPHSGLRMENVHFRYTAERDILRNINLEIRPGESAAIVGLSGSGKSSLARLFVRLADPWMGSVLLDQRRVADYTLAALRSHISYVPQTPVLFQGTIRENLLCANPGAGRRDLEKVVAATQLEPVLSRLERGLDHPLQAAAAGLSGGELQRLAIARALLRDSAVLILDESTSALDAPTEASVLGSIRDLRPERTLIVISHRVKALSWVDRIFLLEDGLIAAEGNHTEMYVQSALYRSLLHGGPDQANRTLLDRVTSLIDRLEVDGDLERGGPDPREAARGLSGLAHDYRPGKHP